MSVTGAPIKGLTDRDVQALESRPRAEAILKFWWVRTLVKLMGLETGRPRFREWIMAPVAPCAWTIRGLS